MALNIVEKVDGAVKVQHAIVSVSDKSGLDRLIPGLLAANPDVKLYSTGGSHKAIADLLGAEQSARSLVSIADYTGQPEMQGGLVKTLDFKIYLGLLGETCNPDHARDLERAGAVAFDIVVVNLYPFQATVARPEVTPEQARTHIDIGGPCMIRAAAKNFLRVAALTRPADYESVLTELRATEGCLSLPTRFELAARAFEHTAQYDRAIGDYFGARTDVEVASCYQVQ